MGKELAERISHVIGVLQGLRPKELRFERPPEQGSDRDYYRLIAIGDGFRVFVVEVINKDRSIIRYSYELLNDDETILRYDNSPHYPKLGTYPDHKHIHGSVEPLNDPSLEAFVNEASKVLSQTLGGP